MLMALADVYDALISQRTYKQGLPHERAREIIRQKAGSQFDPDIVDAFMIKNYGFFQTSQSIADKTNPT